MLLFGPYTKFIPKSVLAGLLFITAARLIDWKRLRYALRASWFDAGLVLVTALSAIFISVDSSILIGVGLSILLFVPRASKLGVRELVVAPERVVRARQPGEQRANSVLIFDLEGELFFGAAPELDQCFENLKKEIAGAGAKYLVLRLRRARNPDVVAVEHLEHFLRDSEKRNLTVLLAGVRPEMLKMMYNLGFQEWLAADRVYPEKEEVYSATLDAVRHAYKLLAQSSAAGSPSREERETAYYLV